MLAPTFAETLPRTPAMLYVASTIRSQARILSRAVAPSGFPLYSLKACSFKRILELLRDEGFGFSVSSVFEARLARQSSKAVHIHYVSPGLAPQEVDEICHLCNAVTLNSLEQLVRFRLPRDLNAGVRLNPKFRIVQDERYDPCRKSSKLGVHLSDLRAAWSNRLRGLHFHSASGCDDWQSLLSTVKHIEATLGDLLGQLDWINLGGGYNWNTGSDFGPLQETLDLLTAKYSLRVFLEPGCGIVNSAGYLVASVIDIFQSDGKTVAVLDATTNHLPEVFEYQFEPDVVSHVDGGKFEYVLAGCSCLAGDIFGEYAFDAPLSIGARVTFANVGAYSFVKANMFNGINLPSAHLLNDQGELELLRSFDYQDYESRLGYSTMDAQ